jgi:hypothetical protein
MRLWRRLGERIRKLREPRAWTVGRLRRRLGCPGMSLATFARRVWETANWRRPRLVTEGDPEEASKLAAIHQAIDALPRGAVTLAEDETHVNLLPRVRSTAPPGDQRAVGGAPVISWRIVPGAAVRY